VTKQNKCNGVPVIQLSAVELDSKQFVASGSVDSN